MQSTLLLSAQAGIGMNMKKEILQILRSSDGYVSGQYLCNQLGVSRTAVWKVINQLKEEGYEIQGVSKRGYQILNTPDILSKEEIESRMNTKYMAKEVLFLEETNSTNTQAKILAAEEAANGLLVVAEQQSMGKGRRGRSWSSPRGNGIWMSLLLKPAIKPSSASMITLVAALATAKAVKEQTGLEAKIKWPNDIVVNGKKICGILTEMSSELDYIHYIIIGIGLNANTKEFPKELQEVATSLYLEAKREVGRSQLIACIMEFFEAYFMQFEKEETLSGFLKEYNSLLVNQEQEVRVMEPQREYHGVALGIDQEGALLVRLSDNTVKRVVSGEVSVRGIYGYVS